MIDPRVAQNAAAGDGFQHIVFTPDGKFAVTYSSFQGLEIRDPDSLAVLRSVPSESTTNFFGRALDISADGSVIEAETPDGPRLYDFESLTPIGDPYHHDMFSSQGPAATYAHDVDWLATSVGDYVVVLDVDPDMWESNACLLAGRNLSRAEWEQYGFSEPYHQTCPQWGEYPTTPETNGRRPRKDRTDRRPSTASPPCGIQEPCIPASVDSIAGSTPIRTALPDSQSDNRGEWSTHDYPGSPDRATRDADTEHHCRR